MGKIQNIVRFYREGFAQMDVGRTLWVVVVVKLIIIFAILKIFFFPDVLSQKAGQGSKADYISTRLTGGE